MVLDGDIFNETLLTCLLSPFLVFPNIMYLMYLLFLMCFMNHFNIHPFSAKDIITRAEKQKSKHKKETKLEKKKYGELVGN